MDISNLFNNYLTTKILPYFGERFEDSDFLDGFSKKEVKRILNAANEKPILFDAYRDFSLPHNSLFVHRYILHKDKNKLLVWITDGFQVQREASVLWLLSRLRHLKMRPKIVESTALVLPKIAAAIMNGVPLNNPTELLKHVDGLNDWFGEIRPTKWVGDFFPLVLIYLSVLFQDYSWIKADLSSFICRHMISVIDKYEKSSNSLKSLTRQNYSAEITEYINLLTEFDMHDDPVSILKREWQGWSLEYNGIRLAINKIPVGYELSSRMARGLPVDYLSLIREKRFSEFIKARHLVGLAKYKVRVKRKDRAFWAGESVRLLVEMILTDSQLSEYEALLIVRGRRDVYKDETGEFLYIPKEQISFFVALKHLGLKPTQPTLRIRKSAGQSDAFCLFSSSLINEPHAILFLPGRMDPVRSQKFADRIANWNVGLFPLLVISHSLHLNNEKVNYKSVLKVIGTMAQKRISLAEKLCDMIRLNLV